MLFLKRQRKAWMCLSPFRKRKKKSMSATNMVLVHGAWVDGSSWSGVIERLQKAGYTVTAVQLDLTGLSEDVERVRQVLSAQTRPTILVAHSFGGAGITRPTTFGVSFPSLVMTAQPKECATSMVGLVWALNTCRTRSTSSESPVKSSWTAVTV